MIYAKFPLHLWNGRDHKDFSPASCVRELPKELQAEIRARTSEDPERLSLYAVASFYEDPHGAFRFLDGRKGRETFPTSFFNRERLLFRLRQITGVERTLDLLRLPFDFNHSPPLCVGSEYSRRPPKRGAMKEKLLVGIIVLEHMKGMSRSTHLKNSFTLII